jgi:BMFP domain-containing protein YqiC
MASQTEDSLQREELEQRIALLEAALKNSQQASAGNKDK